MTAASLYDPHAGQRSAPVRQSAGVSLTPVNPRHFSAAYSVVPEQDYRRLTPHIIKRRQIVFPQVGRSHNALVAGSSPARPTLMLYDVS